MPLHVSLHLPLLPQIPVLPRERQARGALPAAGAGIRVAPLGPRQYPHKPGLPLSRTLVTWAEAEGGECHGCFPLS